MLSHKREKRALLEECKERTFQRMREKAAAKVKQQVGSSEAVVESRGRKRKVVDNEEEGEVEDELTSKRRRVVEESPSSPLSPSMAPNTFVQSVQVASNHTNLECQEQTSMVVHQVYYSCSCGDI